MNQVKKTSIPIPSMPSAGDESEQDGVLVCFDKFGLSNGEDKLTLPRDETGLK